MPTDAACHATSIASSPNICAAGCSPTASPACVARRATTRSHLDLGETLISAVARAVGVPIIDRAVSLQVPGQPARRIELRAIVDARHEHPDRRWRHRSHRLTERIRIDR